MAYAQLPHHLCFSSDFGGARRSPLFQGGPRQPPAFE